MFVVVVYLWTENDGLDTRAVALSDISGQDNAPTVALQVIVSETDRHANCIRC